MTPLTDIIAEVDRVYVIRTLHEICLERETELTPSEDGIAYEIITALSRGKARAQFCHHYNLGFTEVPLRIVKVCDSLDHDYDEVALRIHAAVLMYHLSEQEEWEYWRFECADGQLP